MRVLRKKCVGQLPWAVPTNSFIIMLMDNAAPTQSDDQAASLPAEAATQPPAESPAPEEPGPLQEKAAPNGESPGSQSQPPAAAPPAAAPPTDEPAPALPEPPIIQPQPATPVPAEQSPAPTPTTDKEQPAPATPTPSQPTPTQPSEPWSKDVPLAVLALTDDELRIAATYYLQKNQKAIAQKGVQARRRTMQQNLDAITQLVHGRSSTKLAFIARKLNLSPGLTAHYLQILVRQNKIKATGHGQGRKYFA